MNAMRTPASWPFPEAPRGWTPMPSQWCPAIERVRDLRTRVYQTMQSGQHLEASRLADEMAREAAIVARIIGGRE